MPSVHHQSGQEPQDLARLPVIRSGDWARWQAVRDYRSVYLGQVLVERLVWNHDPGDVRPKRRELAREGYVWFRFWLFDHGQVIERYYDSQGRLLGTHLDLCTPPKREGELWYATGLLLEIWIAPDGQVVVRNEPAFERAQRQGLLTAADAIQADRRCRELTAAIAKGRFPPALVRNWQVDLEQLRRSMEEPTAV